MSAAPEFAWMPQDAKAELRAVFENSPLALAECRPDGRITPLNPAMEKRLADGPNMVRRPRLPDLVHSRDRAETERLLGELFAGKCNSFYVEVQVASQRHLPLRWTVWRASCGRGNSGYALVVVEEILENRQAERLRRAERLESVGRLAGGVAHDFNNLLTGVLLYCDLLITNLEPEHRVRRYANEIRNASRQATALVQQLLAVSRPITAEPRPLSLNEIAGGMRNLLSHLIGETIDLQFRLDPDLGLIRMDPTQAQQILLNLVLNARDAQPQGGRIVVETSNCKVQVLPDSAPQVPQKALLPCVLLVVADRGCGMDAATREHLFEAFFTTKANGKGTGLGLATVHDIVTSNGGLIDINSAPGEGTRVTVLLPLLPQRVLPSPEPADFQAEGNQEAFSSQEEE